MTAPITAAPSADRLRRRDGLLGEWAAQLLAHDDRVRGLDVNVCFDGGVAHLTGRVADAGQLDVVRELLGRLYGVLGVWDRVIVAGREPVVLDLGCGDTVQYPSNIGVDLCPSSATQVLADVSRPLPFARSTVDTIFTVHVLEHLADFLSLIDECHRVLRPGGALHVLSPWWRHVNAVADPTHLRLIDTQTIKGICSRAGSPLRWYPRHVACDGATVFADLTPAGDAQESPGADRIARFFD